MGQSYYFKTSQFQDSVEQWMKAHSVSTVAYGLSKLSPLRNTSNDEPTVGSMKQNSTTIRLTLCAPSDVSKELAILSRTIEEWNLHHWDATNIGKKLRHWLSDASPNMSDRPQSVINRQLIDEADLIGALFWSRFGTPTGIAASGTEEEIRRAIAQKKRVFLYFSDLEPLPFDADHRQLERLNAFRMEMRDKGLAWSFKNKSELKNQFQRHLDQYMDGFIAARTIGAKTRKKAAPQIHQSGNNNTLITGNKNATTIYQAPPVIKQIVPPPAGSISSAEQLQIGEWIESLVNVTMNKSREEAFAMWWTRLKKRFQVSKYEHIPSETLPEVEGWYRQQMAIAKSQKRTKAPDQWRSHRIVAIKAAMGAMSKSKELYYQELSDRLNMKRPFQSLTNLTKTDLERVYRMVLSDARR